MALGLSPAMLGTLPWPHLGLLCQHCLQGLPGNGKDPSESVQIWVLLSFTGFFPCRLSAIPYLSSQIQTRNIRHLPDILVINCEVNSSKEADFWRMQAEVRTGAGNRALGVIFGFLFLVTSICD